jgi:anti-sigma regulatory factor (Ser/Thr protein kinase)
MQERERCPLDHDHIVQFYESDADLASVVGSFLLEGMQGGEVAVVVATDSHRRTLAAHLVEAGVDPQLAAASGQLLLLDAHTTLARFTVDGRIDPGRFEEVAGELLDDVAADGRPVRVFGEMVALLWDAGDVAGAIELEDCWNRLAEGWPFSLLCAYPAAIATADNREAVEAVCRLHTEVVDGPVVRSPAARSDHTRAASRAFAGDGVGVRAARHFALHTLDHWDLGERRDDTALVVTELVTNAVLHSHSDFTLTLSLTGGSLRVAVGDSGCQLPRLRHPTELATSGRGVQIVATLAERWGVEVVGDGKVVWAELIA